MTPRTLPSHATPRSQAGARAIAAGPSPRRTTVRPIARSIALPNAFPNALPIARAVALALVAGGAAGSVHAQQAFSQAWFAAKGAVQGNVAATGRLPNGMLAGTPDGPQQQSQAARQRLQRSIDNLNLAAQAIAAQQAMQQAARDAAQAAASPVPDGLAEGGLKVDTNSLTRGWIHANAPAQTVADGKTTVTIEQTQAKAILNWETFNVGKNTTVDFKQQADWAALNRVNDPQARPSQIQGRIRGDGTVLIVNRNGILFGGGSQVDTRNLVAAAAKISDGQFTGNGLYGANGTPTFTDALGAVQVEQGSRITTREPDAVTTGGGYVLLLGKTVHNAGEITARKGQALLAAGDSFVIRKGVGTEGNTASTTRGNEVAPLFAADSGAGAVGNSGLILAREGDITLAGRDVRQQGVAIATTTVNTRGTIHLLNSAADAAGRVTLGNGATTAVLVEDDGRTTALDTQRDALIKESLAQDRIRAQAAQGTFDNYARLADRRDQSRVEIVAGGSIVFEGGSLTLATGGQIAASAAGRSFLADKAQLDVAGAVGVSVAMEANNVLVNVQGNELRDAPLNRDSGKLANNNVWIDRRRLVYVPAGTGSYQNERWYTAGGLLEVGGYLGKQGHRIGEWAAQGGTVTLGGAEVVTQPGSSVNLAGGTLDVATGYLRNTWLKGSDGRLYTVENAPAGMVFSGVYKGFETEHARWGSTASEAFYNPLIAPQQRLENGYSAGRDAGSLIVSAPTAIVDGDVIALAFDGAQQTRRRNASADGYKQAQTAVAQRGGLVFGNFNALGLAGGHATDVRIAAGQQGPALEPGGAIAADRLNTTWLDGQRLSGYGLGRLEINTSKPAVVEAEVRLADGGRFSLTAPRSEIGAAIVAHSGEIVLTNVYQTQGGSLAGSQGSITLRSGAVLDASGTWTNAVKDPRRLAGLAYIDGGSVTLRSTQDVVLETGSLIDVSSGAALRSGGSLAGGRGGNVALVADYAIPGASDGTGTVALGGTIRGYGVLGGGKLTVEGGPAIVLGGRLLAKEGELGAGERVGVDLVADAAFTVRAGEILPADYHYTRTVALAGERVAGVPAFSSEAPVVLGADWTLPPAQHVAYTLMVDSVPIEVTPFTQLTLRAGQRITGIANPGEFPPGYVVPAGVFAGGIPIQPAAAVLRAGDTAAAAVTFDAGTHILAGMSLARPVKVRPLQHLDAGLTGLGFSSYVIDGHQGLAVADGARIAATVPVLRPGANAPELATGADAAMALEIWTPPLHREDPLAGRLTQRAGADLTLDANAARTRPGGGVSIGTGAEILVDPGHAIALHALGPIHVDGRLAAPGGTIDVIQVNTASNGGASADPQGGRRVIEIGGHAVLDAAGRAFTALDQAGRRYGIAQDGGSITIGAPTLLESAGGVAQAADAFVVVRAGALLEASGASTTIDQRQPGGTGGASAPLALAGNGGTIALHSFQGLYLDGTLRAAAGGSGALGGALILTLQTPRYGVISSDPSVPDELRYFRELTIGQRAQPSGAADGLRAGRARISAEQIQAGGFDSFTAYADLVRFDGSVDLALGRALTLYHGGLLSDGSGMHVHLAAPYVNFRAAPFLSLEGDPVYPKAYTPTMTVSALPTRASFSVDADLIDLGKLTLHGVAGSIRLVSGTRAYDAPGFDTAVLTSRGDIRLGGGVTGTRLLELDAAQLYPYGSAIGRIPNFADWATIKATERVRIGRTTDTVPEMPYSLFGGVRIWSPAIEQGGILRAPMGAIQFGEASNGIGNNYDRAVVADTVTLLPGSITSVSARHLSMPYGGTVDGLVFSNDGNRVTQAVISEARVVLSGRANDVQAGAVIDLSGGGDLPGSAFISGRGGSVDVLATALADAGPGHGYSRAGSPVYALVPGAQPFAAPVGGGAGALPATGQQVTIPDGVPGLPGGTYTLMPARYALMPGAYRVEVGGHVGPAAQRTVDAGNGSWIVQGRLGVAGTGRSDALATQLIVTPGKTVRRYAQYDETGLQAFLMADAARSGAAIPYLLRDAKSLEVRFPELGSAPSDKPALTFAGSADFTPAEGGQGGTFTARFGERATSKIEVVHAGQAGTAGYLTLVDSTLDGIGAARLLIGGYARYAGDSSMVITAGARELVVRPGAVLSAPEVMLVASHGGITVEDGAVLSSIGKGRATPYSAGAGYITALENDDLFQTNLVSVSNGLLNVSVTAGNGAGPGIRIGAAELYAEGALTLATGARGALVLDPAARYGARYLNLGLANINIGETSALDAARAAGVLPGGLSLSQAVLDGLLQGNRGAGIPKLETLILSAGQSINFFGPAGIDTIDPVTGKSSLAELVFNTPAIYGSGASGDKASVTTGTLIWNGVRTGAGNAGASAAAPAVVPGGAGTGSGTLTIAADRIEFGYVPFSKPDTQLTLDRTTLGFATVNLLAQDRITANQRNTLSVYQSRAADGSYHGGDLNLVTPLLTGEGASINRIQAGGALALVAPQGAAAPHTDVTGAEIGLQGGSVRIAGTIALPSGKLTLTADQDLILADGARIDLAGRALKMIDVTQYSWGGDLVLASAHGNIRQQAGAVIDLSAVNNSGGSLSASALDAGQGTIELAGAILGQVSGERDMGGTMMPYAGAAVDLRAQSIAGFAALNEMLNRGGVFGGRDFQLKRGDLAVGSEVKANRVALSVDGGSLAVNGRIDASGAQAGTIRLSARDGLVLGAGAVLDAHGTRLRVDSRGQPIDASNRATVELTASGGRLALAPGAAIDVRSADGVARGMVTFNAPRLSESGGDIAIDVAGPVAIDGARSLAVNGFWRYTDAPAGTPGSDGRPVQRITQAYLDAIHERSTVFENAALANPALQARLAGLKAYGAAYHLRPGVEIASATPDGNLLVDGDLDLSGYRYGPTANPAARGSGEPGMLVIRAGGDLVVKGSINDGFAPPPATPDDYGWRIATTVKIGDPLPQAINSSDPWQFESSYQVPADCWDCLVFTTDGGAYFNGDTVPAGASTTLLMLPQGIPSPFAFSSTTPRPEPGRVWAVSPMLPVGSQSWSMRLAAGADLLAADSRRTGAARKGDLVFDDEHFTGIDQTLKAISVVRTGTGDLDLLAGGSVAMKSLYGVYTAGTQSAPILAADGSNPYNQPRGVPRGASGVLGSAGAAYESLVSGAGSPYQAWYPEAGGNLYIAAQGDVTGYGVAGANTSAMPGNWLWRQGGAAYGLPTAWWVNFGTYALPINSGDVASNAPQMVGFTGFGALGGGNVAIRAGGDAGMIVDPGSSVAYASQGLTIAVGGSGRVAPDGRLVQTGGGDIALSVGGALNPMSSYRKPSIFTGREGVITAVRGAIDVQAGSIGRIDLGYGVWNYALPGDPRAFSSNEPNQGLPFGGPYLTLGDGTATLRSRGDLVLSGADDAGRTQQQNTTPYSLVADGVRTDFAGGGYSWFSLWTGRTAVDLFAAGGNLTPVLLGERARREYPATLRATAAQGSIYYGAPRDTINPVVTSLILAPSATGELELLARDSIYALRSAVDMSGADPAAIATPANPAFLGMGRQLPVGNLSADSESRASPLGLFTFGPNTVQGDLHAGDGSPQRFYAVEGDIIGLRTGELLDHTSGGTSVSRYQLDKWHVAAKPVRIIAGRDIIGSGEPAMFLSPTGQPVFPTSASYGSPSQGNLIYHANATDVSVVRAGRDIQLSNFQVAGPGTLDISAGRNLYQADKASVTSIGPLAGGDTRPGASIALAAGAGANGPDYAAIARRYLDPANLADPGKPLADQPGKVAKTYLGELGAWLKARYGYDAGGERALAYFNGLAPEQQAIFLRQVYFDELKAGGREYNDPASRRYQSYLRGRNMIATLFPDQDAQGKAIERGGSITLFGGSGVRTDFGGGIDMLAPGGQIVVGVQGEVPPASAGVMTQGNGDIRLFSRGSILLGLSRIMTTYGGGILAWSAAGDINAGRGSKTTVVYTPPRRVYDDLGDVKLSPQVPSTGAGIATLAPIPEVPPGDLDLLAPLGTIDAGEAGIRFSGSANFAALQIVNAANIVGNGKATGLPVIAAVNVSALANAGAVAGSAASAAQDAVQRERAAARQAMPSVFTVRMLGTGGEAQPGSGQADPQAGKPMTYRPGSAVQVLGDARLGEAARSQLTAAERRSLGL